MWTSRWRFPEFSVEDVQVRMEVQEDDDVGVQPGVEVSKVDVVDDQEEAEVRKDLVDAGDDQVEVEDVQVEVEDVQVVPEVQNVDVRKVEVQKEEVQMVEVQWVEVQKVEVQKVEIQ